MNRARGQALVELALCLPVLLLLGFGVSAVVEVADASTGLHAATEAAVAAAARAPNDSAARAAAEARFASVVSAYQVHSPALALDDSGFSRGSTVSAVGTGFVDLRWEAMAFLPGRVDLSARASARIEPWRTR